MKKKELTIMYDGSIIGTLCRKYRQEKQAIDRKWTLEHVADKADVDPCHYGKLERGEKREPQFVTIGKISDALEISLDSIWLEYKKEKKCKENV